MLVFLRAIESCALFGAKSLIVREKKPAQKCQTRKFPVHARQLVRVSCASFLNVCHSFLRRFFSDTRTFTEYTQLFWYQQLARSNLHQIFDARNLCKFLVHETPQLKATGRHLPYGIIQCYLSPDTSEHIQP